MKPTENPGVGQGAGASGTIQKGLELSEDTREPLKNQARRLTISTHRISVRGERFVLDRAGSDAIVLPVRDRHGVLSDLCAWRHGTPGRWYLHDGEAVVLGEQQLAGARIMGGTIPCYPTPAAWQEAAGCGVCVLRWDVILAPLFDGTRIDLSHLPAPIATELDARLWGNFRLGLPRIVGGRRRAA